MPKSNFKPPKINLLMTGDELVYGDTVDSNSAYIGRMLGNAGFYVSKKIVVGDHLASIVDEITNLSLTSDVVIVNGGLGPTEDDLSAEAAALASGQPLVKNKVAEKHLFSKVGKQSELNSAQLKQAILPEKAEVIANLKGSAVGFALKLNQALFLFTPGVPLELYDMMEKSVLPQIKALYANVKPVTIYRWMCFGSGESFLQATIDEKFDKNLLRQFKLGFCAKGPYVEIKFAEQGEYVHDTFVLLDEQLRRLFGDAILSSQSVDLAHEVIAVLNEKNKKLGVCESCTGGLLSSRLIAVPGASRVVQFGIVTYSNQSKCELVGVTESALGQYGAVSREVAEEMVQGVLKFEGVDFSIGITGIAGPDGGTEEKPVGTVWIAWGNSAKINSRKFVFCGERDRVQLLAAETALDLLRLFLKESLAKTPYYFDQLSR